MNLSSNIRSYCKVVAVVATIAAGCGIAYINHLAEQRHPSVKAVVDAANGNQKGCKDIDRNASVPAATNPLPQQQPVLPPLSPQPPAEGAQPPAEGAQPPAEGAPTPAEGAPTPAEGAQSPTEEVRQQSSDSQQSKQLSEPRQGEQVFILRYHSRYEWGATRVLAILPLPFFDECSPVC